MGLPKTFREVEAGWGKDNSSLECELLLHDFFRREEGYSTEHPLILCRDGGLMALYSMDGLDPETMDEDGLEGSSAAIRRAIDVLNPMNQEGEWRHGVWEVQNIWTRSLGAAPTLAQPTRDSAALRYLVNASNNYWQQRVVFEDSILWVFRYLPRFREKNPLTWRVWRLRDSTDEAVVKLKVVQDQARMFRRTMRVVEENLMAFSVRRPKMGFGFRALSELEAYKAIWRVVNRRWGEPMAYRPELPLVTQVALSTRDDSAEHYTINGRTTKVLTWKIPPATSIAYVLARLQNQVRFPLTVTQTFRCLDFSVLSGRVARLGNFAAALAKRHRESAAYSAEAQDFLGSVRTEGACPCNWYFSILVQGETAAEAEDRATKVATQLKMLDGAEVLEERESRVLGELSSLPGNGQFGLRANIITSKNVGDLAMVYRLSPGDKTPFLLFGDRKGGVFGYSLFTRREPSWNKAVLGLPGSGKSMLMNAFLLGNANFDSQGYVLDKGNSFGPVFELLAAEMPEDVAVMRLRGGDFRFNPFPLVWALDERERQKAAGTYRMVLEGGDQLSCPVEDARAFFESWLDALVGQGNMISPTEKNRLDRALKGANGEGGFFRDYENQCHAYLQGKGRGLVPPRPLSALLTHLRNEAPEFVPAVELWTRTPRDRFFDSGTDSVASAKYVYFELSGLEDDPLLAVPFVTALMGSVWKRIQNPRTIREKKCVIVDEAWSFLAHPAFFKVVEDMFRTVRKFNGFIVLSTQTPKDLKDGQARKLLQSMAEVFLYRGFSEPTFMEQDLRLTKDHLRLHENLQEDDKRREVYYVSGSGLNRVLSVEIPPALYWFATTDGDDKYWRGAFCKRFGLAQGIHHLVEACEGRTIGGGELRLQKVRAYATKLGIG
jgi:TraG P-loop domain